MCLVLIFCIFCKVYLVFASLELNLNQTIFRIIRNMEIRQIDEFDFLEIYVDKTGFDVFCEPFFFTLGTIEVFM